MLKLVPGANRMRLTALFPDAVFFNGPPEQPALFDAAIMGVVERSDCYGAVLYDHDRCLDALTGLGMSSIDALEYMMARVSGAEEDVHAPFFFHAAESLVNA